MSKISTFFIASPANDFRPAALSYRAFLAYGVLIIFLRIILGALPAGSAAVESGTLMALINDERQARNLNTLTANSSLITAATQKSQDMIDRDYFAHVDPDGNYVWPKINAAGYGSYKILGENLAVDFLTSEGMIKAWLDSPAHRANLLHTDFRDQGLSALYGDYQGRYSNLTASLFGAKQSSSPPPTPVAPPVPTPTPPAVKSNQNPPPPPPAPTPVPTPNPEPTPAPAPNAGGGTPVVPTATKTAPILPGALSGTEKETVSPALPTGRQARGLAFNMSRAFGASRIIFTLLGMFLLGLLSVDSVIIHRHIAEMESRALVLDRSHSSYHLTSFMIITLVSILVWWW